MKKKKSKLRKICASNIWFLIGTVLFLISGIRSVFQQDDTGAVISFLAALLFLIGYIGRVEMTKSKRNKK